MTYEHCYTVDGGVGGGVQVGVGDSNPFHPEADENLK